MTNLQGQSEGVSEILSVVIILALLAVLAFVVYVLIFGALNPYLIQTSRVAASAGTTTVPLDATSSMQILYVLPESGQNFYLKGQSNILLGSPVADFVLYDASGNSYQVIPASISSNANMYGTTLFLYQGQDQNYYVTNNLNSISYNPTHIRPFALGTYGITMYDSAANVPLTTMNVLVTGNATPSSALPSIPLLNVLPNSTWNAFGGVTSYTDANGLTIYNFDGTSGYLTSTSNPALTFTGDLTLSLWMNPTSTGDAMTPSNWHTIIGKGQLNSDGSEYDDYQLVQLGNQLYFEWNDAVTQTHYNILTTANNGVISAGTMQYVTLTVNNGQPAITVNGNTEQFSTYSGNEPQLDGAATIISSPSPVDMSSNSNNLLTGKQNGPAADAFYYQGGMSEVALYNRAISGSEITHNIQYGQV